MGFLIEKYTKADPNIDIICYKSGYKGLLSGDFIAVTPAVREHATILQMHGGSPIGNSRVKLTNVADCIKRGLVKEGEVPLEVAAKQLIKDSARPARRRHKNLSPSSTARFFKHSVSFRAQT